jgi:hypothetical protein
MSEMTTPEIKTYNIQDNESLGLNQKKEVKLDPEVEKALATSENSKDIYPAQDFVDGVLYYALKSANGYVVVGSNYEAMTDKQLADIYRPRAAPMTSHLDKKTVERFLTDKPTLEQNYEDDIYLALEVFENIKEFLEKYIFFKIQGQSTLLSIWIMNSYVFSIFPYTAYLHITAEKQSGKTLLMNVMSKILFNSVMTANMSSASLYRKLENDRSTLLLDEAENLRKSDKQKFGELLGILNSGFEKNGRVIRVDSVKNSHTSREYTTYGPKCFAGINSYGRCPVRSFYTDTYV